MSADLVAFLRARLDEVEAKARAATAGPWEAVVDNHGQGEIDASVWADSISYYVTEKISSGDRHVADAEHIALHDPKRVLAEVESKRRRLARHAPTDDPLHGTLCSWCSVPQVSAYQEWPCPDIRDDAAVYADHPDYRDEWRP